MDERTCTMADVATEAGVSTATVSRVLNGGVTSDAARSAVEAAARRLNYRRNDLARSLATGRTGVAGLLIPDVSGPLYAQMARGVEEVLTPAGMRSMMASDHRDPEQEPKAVELLLGRRVDALILIGTSLPPASLAALVGGATPLVLVQPEREAGDRHAVIEIDNEGGVRAAIAHLVERGHTRIAHVRGLRRDAEARVRAHRTALAEHGLEAGPIVDSDSTEEGGLRAGPAVASAWHRDGVRAVLCSNDRVAAGLCLALRREGVRVPEDVSVVGFDDLPWSRYLSPPLTTLRQPAREMGREAARRILEIARGGGSPRRVRVPVELVVRDSVHDLRPSKEVRPL